jgi:hypothetical protein
MLNATAAVATAAQLTCGRKREAKISHVFISSHTSITQCTQSAGASGFWVEDQNTSWKTAVEWVLK